MKVGILMARFCRPAAAQDTGNVLLERVFTKRHTLTSTLERRNNCAGWSGVVDDMVARGAEASDREK